MNNFAPLMTKSSPSVLAVVCVPPASDPAFGSVNPNAPNDSPVQIGVKYFCFCSSVPNKFSGAPPNEIWAEYVIPVEAHARLNSSVTIAKLTVSAPPPPYCSGNGKPIIPISESCLNTPSEILLSDPAQLPRCNDFICKFPNCLS